MSADSLKERPLHDLVEGLFQEQKHDIHLYCHGHLNHKNLYSPPEKASHTPWASSSKEVPIPVLRQPSKLPSPRRTKGKNNAMREAMYDFSMGTAGSLPLQGIGAGLGTPATKHTKEHGGKNHRAASPSHTSTTSKSRQHHLSGLSLPSPQPSPIPNHVRADTQLSHRRQNSVASYVSDNVYIEELLLPELMLPTAATRGGGHLPSNNSATQQWDKHQFVETHLGGITKKDQFNRFIDFQNGVLKTSEMFEKGVLSGRKAVEHLEKRLYEDLVELDDVHRQSGPNFHRLQIYSNAWQALIDDSPTFRDVLTDIKAEYEVYMGSLLDTQPHKHSQVLVQQVDNLAAGSPVIPGEVKEGYKNVQQLEMDAKSLLEENDRLRQQVRDERQLLEDQPPPPKDHELPKSALAIKRSSKKDTDNSSSNGGVTEQILAMHAGILEQMEQLKQLRCELQEHYVPISVCQHLDQCVRDTEAEVLKVLSTNEYLEKTIQQLEMEIEKLMERGNAPDTDMRQIWKGINTLSLTSSHETL